MVDDATLRELLHRIAERTLDYDFSTWYWGDAIAIDGLLDAAELLDHAPFADAVKHHSDRWVRRIEASGCTWVDHLTPGWAVIRVGGDGRRDAVATLAEFLAAGPRSRWLNVPLRRPDIFGDRNLTVVDSFYNEGPLFTHLGAVTGDERYFDMGRDVLEPMVAALVDPEIGVFRQALDMASRRVLGLGWGRGSGWALLGIVDALEFMPSDRPEYARLAQIVVDVCERLLPMQDASGFWHTLLHNRDSYLETSTAAFFAATFDKGARLGILDGDRFAGAADRALAALCTRIDDEGRVYGVSVDSFPAEEREYLPLATGFNEWGQGSGMRALAERMRARSV